MTMHCMLVEKSLNEAHLPCTWALMGHILILWMHFMNESFTFGTSDLRTCILDIKGSHGHAFHKEKLEQYYGV